MNSIQGLLVTEVLGWRVLGMGLKGKESEMKEFGQLFQKSGLILVQKNVVLKRE